MQCMQKRQRKVVKGSYLGGFTVWRTHKSLFDPLMMLVTSNKGWKSEKIKLVSATLCHTTAPEVTTAGNSNKNTITDTDTKIYTNTETNKENQHKYGFWLLILYNQFVWCIVYCLENLSIVA